MVVRFHFHQDVSQLRNATINAVRVGAYARDLSAFHYGRIVAIRHHRAARLRLVGKANHPEQGLGLRLSIDHPVRVEDFVAAML